MNTTDYPFAETGPRDEVRSLGYSDIPREVHPDNVNTTYKRDYEGPEPVVEGYGNMFRTGQLTTANIGKKITNSKISTPNLKPLVPPVLPTIRLTIKRTLNI